MPYIGKSPTGTGVRSRYYFTASGGETLLSGASDSGTTLSFTDGAYIDVSLNGVALVAGTDYNTTTANTIGGLTALAASDIVEILVYDIFTVADTVSASSGGTFSGAVTASSGLNVGTIKEATGTTTAMTIDSSGRILTPANPKFSVYQSVAIANANYTSIATFDVPFDTEEFDVGNCVAISSGAATFTAPVTGYYQFNLMVKMDSTSLATTVSSYLDVNGALVNNASDLSYRNIEDVEGGGYITLSTSALIYVQATQTVKPKLHVGTDTSVGLRAGQRFSGFLVG